MNTVACRRALPSGGPPISIAASLYPLSAQARERLLEVPGRRLLEPHLLPGARVHEAELRGVEHRARGADLLGAVQLPDVDLLAHEGMAGLGEVDADLVLPPRLQAALHQRRPAQLLQRAHVGHRALG